MGSEWLKNHCGMSLDDEQMKVISHPLPELIIHVTQKTVQAFGLLGTVLVGPIAAAAKAETRNLVGLQHRMTRAGRGGLLLGVVAGPLMTFGMIRKDTDDYKVWDRCYRLRHNRGQVRVDRASIIGAGVGAGIGAATAGGPLFGGLVGMSSGILLMAAYNNR